MLIPQLIYEFLLICAGLILAWEIFVIIMAIIAATILGISKIVKLVQKIFKVIIS